MLYLTGGVARGARLEVPKGLKVRPAMARLRVSVFAILEPWIGGATVLDLFAGSGALAFEALSRGAEHAILVERDRRAIEAIRRNARKLRMEDRCTVLQADALRVLPRCAAVGRPAAILFVDPPYDMYRSAAVSARLARLVRSWPASGAAAEEGVAVIEQPAGSGWAAGLGWAVEDARRFGQTEVVFLRWRRIMEVR